MHIVNCYFTIQYRSVLRIIRKEGLLLPRWSACVPVLMKFFYRPLQLQPDDLHKGILECRLTQRRMQLFFRDIMND